MELIGTIQEEPLKSAELTGLWEKKLRQIEKGTYEARTFLEELKTAGVPDCIECFFGYECTYHYHTGSGGRKGCSRKREKEDKV